MPKGYWVGHISITNPDIYREYAAANQVAFKKYGAKYIVRGGKPLTGLPPAKHEVVSGSMRDRHVVIEFDSYETALACHNSPEYQSALKIRERGAVVDLMIIEGFEPAA